MARAFLAAAAGSEQVVTLLLDHGADNVNVNTDNTGTGYDVGVHAQDELGSQVDLFALTGGGRRASRATRFEFGFPS